MSDFKFIHAADIHLDSPLRGLEQYEGAPVEEIRGATRRAFENLVELAIAEDIKRTNLKIDCLAESCANCRYHKLQNVSR